MARILVGSVYGASPRNAVWYRLQRAFLDRSEDRYDFAVFLNGVAPNEVPGAVVVGRGDPNREGSLQHADGVEAITRYFLEHHRYEGYLLLDSDAFPIDPRWRERLERLLRPSGALPQRLMAAVVRPENLDLFPHPCALYLTPALVASLASEARPLWRFAKRRNLLGLEFDELSFDASAVRERPQRWLPLLRTNAVNPHPILAAVYGDLFYHHGAGSRAPIFRACNLGYYAGLPAAPHEEAENVLFQALVADPQRFIAMLTDRESALRSLRPSADPGRDHGPFVQP